MSDLSKYIGLTKGVLTIVDIVKPTANNKYTVVKCKCSVCGEYSEVRLDRFTTKSQYAKHYCHNCRDAYYLDIAKKKFIGKTNGVLECIDIKRVYKPKTGSHIIMAICKCNKCEAITEVRSDRLLASGKFIPKSCSNCVNDIYRETTLNRYYRLYNCTGEEYQIRLHNRKRLISIKNNAQARDLKFLLSDEQAINLLHQNCYYCNKEEADGIDRIDSNKDYTIDNCVPCCKICNVMKNKFSNDVFFTQIKKIYKNHFSNEGSTTISEESTP